MIERNAGVPQDRRIEFRIGVHLGDIIEEADGDLMGDGVNIAARLEGIEVKGRLDLAVSDLGPTQLKNIAEPVRVYSLEVGQPAQVKPALQAEPVLPPERLAVPVGAGARCRDYPRPDACAKLRASMNGELWTAAGRSDLVRFAERADRREGLPTFANRLAIDHADPHLATSPRQESPPPRVISPHAP